MAILTNQSSGLGSGYSSDGSSLDKKQHTKHQRWNYNFDIDHYLNPFLISGPRVLRRLPSPVNRFLGHRDELKTEKDSDLVIWLLAFLGAFAGVAVVEAVFMNWPMMVELGCPIIVGSYVSSPHA